MPPPRNEWEAYAARSEILADTFQPTSDEMLNDLFRSLGCAEEEFAQLRKGMDDNMNRTMREAGVRTMGVCLNILLHLQLYQYVLSRWRKFKPKTGATDVLIYQIPGSPLSIRIWGGGMEPNRQYMLDFFDCAAKNAVNSPKDFEIVPLARSGMFISGPLMSWEVAMGHPRDGIPEGEERFSVDEGSSWMLKWNGGHFSFAVPVRMDSKSPLALPIPYMA